jgi:hypothetical protein
MDTTGKACLAECLDENAWAACVFAEREYPVSVDDDMRGGLGNLDSWLSGFSA